VRVNVPFGKLTGSRARAREPVNSELCTQQNQQEKQKMKKTILAAVLILGVSGITESSAFVCKEYEYAELQDMTAEEIQLQIKGINERRAIDGPKIKKLQDESFALLQVVSRENIEKSKILDREAAKLIYPSVCDDKAKKRFEQVLQRRAAKEKQPVEK
jgi:hypothetical protein